MSTYAPFPDSINKQEALLNACIQKFNMHVNKKYMSTYRRMHVNIYSKLNMHVKAKSHVNIQPLFLIWGLLAKLCQPIWNPTRAPGPLIDHQDNFKLNQSEWHRQWSGAGLHEDHHHYPSPSHRLYFVTVMARVRPWLPVCVCFFVLCNPSRHWFKHQVPETNLGCLPMMI